MVEDEGWHLRHFQLESRQHAAMTGDDFALRIHQNWIVESELLDARGDL